MTTKWTQNSLITLLLMISWLLSVGAMYHSRESDPLGPVEVEEGAESNTVALDDENGHFKLSVKKDEIPWPDKSVPGKPECKDVLEHSLHLCKPGKEIGDCSQTSKRHYVMKWLCQKTCGWCNMGETKFEKVEPNCSEIVVNPKSMCESFKKLGDCAQTSKRHHLMKSICQKTCGFCVHD